LPLRPTFGDAPEIALSLDARPRSIFQKEPTMSPDIIIALAVVLFTTFSAVIFCFVAAYRIVRALRALTTSAERMRACTERLISLLLSALRIQAVPPPTYHDVFAAGVVSATLKIAASILLPLMMGVGTHAVDQALGLYQIGLVATKHEEVRLPDGTLLIASAGAELRVRLELNLRKVNLDRGEVRFKVAKDPNRPFLVETPHTTVKVLGTDFTLNSESLGTHVQVHEGRVQVFYKGVVQLSQRGDDVQRSSNPSDGSILLLTGASTSVDADGRIHDRVVVNATRNQRQGSAGSLVLFNGELLRNVVTEMNKHQEHPFVIVDAEIGEQAVNGMLDMSDRKSLLDWLPYSEIRFEEDAQGNTLLYDAKKSPGSSQSLRGRER
jgi:ferric-dicitrate binding protein FerR (iron transport regulator)